MKLLSLKRRAMLFALALAPLFAVSASASEMVKFIDVNAERQGLLGFATTLGDGVAFAGAPAGVSKPGLGYLFDTASGNRIKLVEPSVQSNDSLFAFSSQIDGEKLIIGDPGNPFASSPSSGAAYVFDSATGNELLRFQPSDSYGGDEFGFGVNLHDDLGIIGAPNLGVGVGAAYLFDLNTGNELHKLMPNDPLAGSEFGADVAVSNDYALVGAPANFDTLGFFPGATYVFDPANGSQLHKLRPNDSFGGDEFGFDMAVSGNLAVIGAPNGGSDIGSAYVFDLSTGTQLFKLQPDDNVAGNDFGASVDIQGDLIAVGASGLNKFNGAVYLFDATTGQQLDKIVGSDSQLGDAFGLSLSLWEDQLLVGSPRDDDSDLNAGAAYLFELEMDNPSILGDFNGNDILDANDIDLMTQALLSGSNDSKFDLNNSGTVTAADRAFWINELFGTYFGDANLDGELNSSDLIQILASGSYEDAIEDNSTWATGDFDGDFDFTSGDLIAALATGAYEQGPRTATAAVPEPTSVLSLWISVAGLGLIRRFRG